MKTIKMKGGTVEEAIEAALSVLGAKKEEVEIKVLNEGKGGILGMLGGGEAEVEVKVKTSIVEEAKARTEALLDKMGLVSLVSAEEEEGDVVRVDIKGDDIGRIIGREGATLEALQLLVSAMISRSATRRIRVLADAAGYRERRARKIEKMALEAAKKAEETGEETTLPPMPAADRRIVHLFIKGRDDVISFSRGEREGRRVVVVPKEKAKELIEKGEKEEVSLEEERESEGEERKGNN